MLAAARDGAEKRARPLQPQTSHVRMVIVSEFTRNSTPGAGPMPRIIVVVLAALTLAACSAQPPEVTANDQVPSDQRTSAASASEPADGGGGANEPTWVAIDIEFESAPTTLPAGETEITLANQGSAQHNVT